LDTTAPPTFTPVRGLLWVVFLALALHVTLDALMFHRIVSGSFGKMWGSPSWLVQPYTSLRLKGKPEVMRKVVAARTHNGYVRNVAFSKKGARAAYNAADKSADETLGKFIKP
jgi:hypothetical protein